MKIVVVGLPEREAFAVALLMGKARPHWVFHNLAVDAVDADGDLYVLDADAWRDHHGHQDATAKLLALLKDKPAVLLTSPMALSDAVRAQAEADERDWAARDWLVLHRPFRASSMREALQRAEQRAAAPVAQRRPLAPAKAPGARAKTGATPPTTQSAQAGPLSGAPSSTGGSSYFSSAFFTTTVQGVSPSPAPTGTAGLPPPDITEEQLTLADFAVCVATSPSAECRQFLGALAERLARPGAFEMSFTLINGVLFDGQARWVASNTPMSVLRMVARSRSLGSYVKTVDMDSQVDPRARAAQRGMQEYPLGAWLHALARMAECQLPAR